MMLFDPRVRGTVAAVEKKLVHAFSHLAVISAAYNLSSAAGPAHERSRRPQRPARNRRTGVQSRTRS